MPSEAKGLRLLIVDDEQPARMRLREILGADASVGEVLEAAHGQEAVERIRDKQPHLVFLDIQMPGMDGMAVVEAIGPDKMPATVFVTAFDAHAIRAFDAAAIDYVLKPYSDERIIAALRRAKARIDGAALLAFGPAKPPAPDRILIKDRGVTEVVRPGDIDCIESAGTYVVLHVGSKRLVHRATLGDLLAQLDAGRFVRVHRSSVINIESLIRLEPAGHGEFMAVLRHGYSVRVSRTFKPQLESLLGHPP